MRFLTTLAAALGLTAAAHAHFVFVYATDDKGEVRVVFGHGATPDPQTFPTRAEKTALTARPADGKDAALTLEKGDGNFYKAKLVGKPAVVFGTTEAGVTQRGDADPTLTTYHPKVIVGDPFAKTAEVGKAVPVELVPVKDGGKVRFKVLAGGKPVEGVEVTVGVPVQDEEGDPVKTDQDGLTPAFAEFGRYCVAARQVDDKPGELDGKRYKAVRRIATLVCDVPKPAK
jgi:uncharacterized GH25 family protein